MVKNSSTPSSTLPMSSRTSLSLSIIVSYNTYTENTFHFKDETNFIFHNLHFQKTHSGTIIYFSAIGGYFGLNLSSDASNQPPGSQSLSNVQFWGSVTGFYMQNESKITHLAECRYDTKTAVVMGDIIL